MVRQRRANPQKKRANPQKKESASSSEDDDADDFDVTELFDEVEFGDGDESHHIYSNMSGIVITWNACAEDTFKVFREEICDMIAVKPNDFYLAYHSKYIKYDHRARDLPHGAWVSINFRGHGRGKRAKSSTAAKEDNSLTRAERIDMKKKELFVIMLQLKELNHSGTFHIMNHINESLTQGDRVIESALPHLSITILQQILSEMDATTQVSRRH
jgi:hypothetical protein